MLEGGVDLLLVARQGEPGLDAGQLRAAGALAGRRAFGMNDAAAGRHQVHRARLDRLERAERIAVIDRAGEQVGDGGEIDVGMRPTSMPSPWRQMRRPHLVEEDERADRRPLLVRQRAVNLEAA
jgi:hypothetical protein